MSELLVFGKGWIGSRVADYFKCPISSVKITTYEDIQKEIDTLKPKVLINCVGHFGKDVDDCEIDKTKTLHTLTTVPLLFAEAAMRNGLKLVHLSSGCIFNYDYKLNTPLTEDAQPDFHDLFYSRAKVYTESALISLGDAANILQLRLRMPLDCIPHPRNLLDKLLMYKSVIDIENSVTYIPDFLDAMRHLIKTDCQGIYNVVNFGGLRYRQLLEEYRKHVPTHNYAIMELSELHLVRTNLLLSTDKLDAAGFLIRDIHDVLPECIEKYINYTREHAGQSQQIKSREVPVSLPNGASPL